MRVVSVDGGSRNRGAHCVPGRACRVARAPWARMTARGHGVSSGELRPCCRLALERHQLRPDRQRRQLRVDDLLAHTRHGRRRDTIDAMARLRHGGIGKVPIGARAISTSGTLLRLLSFGSLFQTSVVTSRSFSTPPGAPTCSGAGKSWAR